MRVFDNDKVRRFLAKHNLQTQYKKACRYIEEGQYKLVDLKLRKPQRKRDFPISCFKKIPNNGF